MPTQVGLGSAIREQVSHFPCLAVFPQISGSRHWNRPDVAAMVMTCLEQTCQAEAVDRTRVYATGISMGGAGVWYLGARFPGTFAALVPVCGGVNYPAAASGHPGSEENRVIYLARAESIAATPVWAFHGADDTVVHPGFTQGMIDALRGLSHAPRHTEYPHCGHAVWELAYSKAELWSWLLEQRLNDTLGQR